MRFDIFTIFPGIFGGPFSESIVKRARERGIVQIEIHDIREHGHGRHRSVDDTPFGGGAGMVMMAPPIVDAVEAAIGDELGRTHVLLMTPGGRLLDQQIVAELGTHERIAIICGRYEGVDQRVVDLLVDDEISIGDYVVSGGELPAAVVVDAVTRTLPGVINSTSLEDESHLEGLLEYPHYTRPAEYRGLAVPEVLLSGHHQRIREWRAKMARERTLARRPDLLDAGENGCPSDA
jgi:tRNA (guanine37-N1)-methyltransferase